MKKVRYLMIGGFLGAGKTTAILRLATYLQQRDMKAGLITNDQSIDLVDTGRARAADRPVEEVTGGCFCCKFDTLMQAAQNLTCQGGIDALIAEPVGSCTDVRATVSYPLRQLFGDLYEVAPLSVLIDPARCAQALGLDQQATFTEKVNYIYRKQLEEADLIVVNKIDILTPELRRKLVTTLRHDFPQARVLEVSCQTGEGLETWFDLLLSRKLEGRPAMEVDYDIYADGEALLGWLNARASFTADPAINGDELMLELMGRLKKQLAARGVEIAHCKMSVESGRPSDFAAISLTSTNSEPSVTWSSSVALREGQFILNLRAEADPDLLRNEVMTALFTFPRVSMKMEEISAFRPGRPTPTHRMASLTA
jgi:Ni2+-binding GTPase involved in maturation of urease and hydrogenase